MIVCVIFFLCCCQPGLAAEEESAEESAEETGPIRALLVTGGCCHDYDAQQRILTEGISARANVTWTIVQEGTDRDTMLELYQSPDWADEYDVVLHNECFGSVSDAALVQRIATPHYEGVPAVVIHCSMHSYRDTEEDYWRELLGVSSFSHEKHRPVAMQNLAVDNPIMTGFPEVWDTPNGELYKIEKIWPHCTPLASAFGEDTQKDHVCAWTNTYGEGRVFGTTIGHHNVTMSDPIYLDMVARGLLWSCDKLDEEGTPVAGYEGTGVTETEQADEEPGKEPTPLEE